MAQALMNYLDPGAIILGVRAETDREVISLLAERLHALGYVKPSFADAVLARESQLPTGLPLGGVNNVAVPHTDPEHVLKPGLAFATLIQPVAFANMEDPDERLPVRLVFLMALNDKDKQVEMLQEIAGAIQSPETIEALIQSKSVEDVSRLLG
ncbi:PTS system galactitol-specific IIA component [Phyllobacterium ifriqiyense]|uniref:PTS system galactitol-specific IIA component n=1 Tax=Phyllobacterium ifriqiyense TaxID=314238 RepID=A0ABU0SCY1_9HYPH|nr:PTS sugar transporter subunit IIA [Phyllobacterium ifriqiyense]MDQ0998619.1 PTS system galactitol-specific IIA component [Phyllobacterium ifriqiyense]